MKRLTVAAAAALVLAGCAKPPSDADALQALQAVADRAAHAQEQAASTDTPTAYVGGAEPSLIAADALGFRPEKVALYECQEDDAHDAWQCEIHATASEGRLAYGAWRFRKSPTGWSAMPVPSPSPHRASQ